MNTRRPPFNKVQVRRAVNYAIDRKALVALYNGLARPTENVLPPTYPSYSKHSLYPYDLAKARRLVEAAHATGTRVTVWNHDRGLDTKATKYLVQVLDSIGLKARVKIVSSATYWATIGNQATGAQIGFADWFQDYPHPLDWFDVLLNGERITKTYNNNYANFSDKAVNREDRRPQQAAGAHEPDQLGVGRARPADHGAGSLGALPEPGVHRLLQREGRPWLLCQPCRLRVRLRDDLHAVDRTLLESPPKTL